MDIILKENKAREKPSIADYPVADNPLDYRLTSIYGISRMALNTTSLIDKLSLISTDYHSSDAIWVHTYLRLNYVILYLQRERETVRLN